MQIFDGFRRLPMNNNHSPRWGIEILSATVFSPVPLNKLDHLKNIVATPKIYWILLAGLYI